VEESVKRSKNENKIDPDLTSAMNHIPTGMRIGKRYTLLRVFELALGALILVCLVALAIRAAVRLETRWDTFLYHLPFAALRGGLGVPYEMNDKLALAFQGFPPLAHWVQGLLWRVTGSVNATGVVNYLAFLSFLALCQRRLGAPFYVVAAIALTAPLVLIHASVSYVDLFGNSWLALGVVCLFYAYYFDKTGNRQVLITGLLGLVAAAWTKFQLVPLVVLFLLVYMLVYRPVKFRIDFRQRATLFWILGTGLIAAAPYLQNWMEFGNPFWPVQVPWFEGIFPYSPLYLTEGSAEFPPNLEGSSQFSIFVHSLFEIGHPHAYPNRHRWIIDQGNAWLAFRSGGFWNVSVVTYLLMAAALSLLLKPKKGIVVVATGVLMLLFVSVLPQSHELRYYMFLPLVWAGMIGVLYRETRNRFPFLGMAVLITVFALFGYVSNINLTYYKIERIGLTEVARYWRADRWWPYLQPGVQYCVIDKRPFVMMMTGPTLSEFNIVDRSRRELCPENSLHIPGKFSEEEIGGMMSRALNLIYQQQNDDAAISLLHQILESNPTHFGAMWQLAVAYERSGQRSRAIQEWENVIREAKRKGYANIDEARSRLEALQNRH
jgi:hypothetical protein